MDVPVLLIGYNRPNFLKKNLDNLSDLGIESLYVFLDGPKPDNPTDEAKVRDCHNVVESFESKINLKFKYNSSNLGCRNTVVSAINWVFQYEKVLIILEDDIEVGINFFNFMKQNLEMYASNKKVFTIGGHNRVKNSKLRNVKYYEATYFTKYPDIWGWGTWKDRWQEYDSNIFRKNKIEYFKLIKAINYSPLMFLYFLYNSYLEKVYSLDTWDFQLTYISILTYRSNLIPSENLVQNIGFGEGGTHTKIDVLKSQTVSNKINVKYSKIYKSNNRIERLSQKSILNLFIKAGIFKFLKRII